jgi:hypothetical protein
MLMKLRAPHGCSAVIFQGRALPIDEDGLVETDEPTAAALASHGFVSWEGDGPAAAARESLDVDAIARMNRPALFAWLKAAGVSVSLPVTNEALRARVLELVAAAAD